MPAARAPTPLQTALSELHPESALWEKAVAGPGSVSGEELGGHGPRLRRQHAALSQELPDDVLLLAVGVGRAGHLAGLLQPMLLPLHAAADRPGQDARQFRLQLLRQGLILLRLRDADEERDEP